MRLTEKCKVREHYRDMQYRPGNFHTSIQCYNKLGQLEDIEDKLGIDLVTLFKAIFSDFIYVKPNKTIRKFPMEFEFGKDNDGWSFEFPVAFFEKYKNEDYASIYLKDYGKTWALTKEELGGTGRNWNEKI